MRRLSRRGRDASDNGRVGHQGVYARLRRAKGAWHNASVSNELSWRRAHAPLSTAGAWARRHEGPFHYRPLCQAPLPTLPGPGGRGHDNLNRWIDNRHFPAVARSLRNSSCDFGQNGFAGSSVCALVRKDSASGTASTLKVAANIPPIINPYMPRIRPAFPTMLGSVELFSSWGARLAKSPAASAGLW